MNKTLYTIAASAVLMASLAGCAHRNATFNSLDSAEAPKAAAPEMVTVTNHIDAAWLAAPTNLFTLGPGDRLEIELLDEPASKSTTVVGPDGKLYFNLLPGLDVWGLSLGQAKQLIEQNLANYIRGTPRINITLREVASQRVWILGRVQAPGVYTMSGPMTLLEAISGAGGSLTFAGAREVSGGPLGEDLADLKRSFIVRNGSLLPVDFDRLLTEGDLSQNIYLQPDDFVYFAPAFAREVYVLGAVVQPRPVIYHDGLSLAGAVAGAYGTVRDAYLNHVVVVRGSVSQPEVAVVDYKAIVNGRAADVALQPHDIVYVPFSPYRYLRKYAEIALNTFVNSVAINAGTRLGPRPAAGVGAGVFIPVGSGIQITPPAAPPIR
ncbi:MAG TPA: polysaccharide biosynthesis/export family protein [Verrucomicrobiae bacterium]|nr:polysaccharide biosynthesis/export family protein [Verrucomicrobiae bacterium]